MGEINNKIIFIPASYNMFKIKNNIVNRLANAHDIIVLNGNQVLVLFPPVEPIMVAS